MEQFEKEVSQFVETTAEKVEALIAEGKEVVLFVGRPTCPYCVALLRKSTKCVKH